MDKELYDQFHQLETKHWWFVARQKILLSCLEQYLPPAPRQILDIGCGTGIMLQQLQHYGEVAGVDTSPEALTYAASKVACPLHAGSLPDKIPYSDASFNLITLLDVLEHVAADQAALEKVYALLRPGGILLCTVPAYPFLWSQHDLVNHHQRRYLKQDLLAKVQKAGFTVEKVSFFNTLLFPIVAASRFLEKIMQPVNPQSDLQLPGNWINRVLTAIFSVERLLLAKGSFPFGVSLLVVAKKNQ